MNNKTMKRAKLYLRIVAELIKRFFRNINRPARTPIDFRYPETPLELPRDLAAHDWAQMEWWYYTGHLRDGKGRRYGFELCFFKRRLDFDRIYGVPVKLFGDTAYMGHFAVVSEAEQKYLARGYLGTSDDACHAEHDLYRVNIYNWKVQGDDKVHEISAVTGRASLRLTLTATKPAALHSAKGIVTKAPGVGSYYLSYTRMTATGELVLDGEAIPVSGQAWFDREFGNLGQTTVNGWDWFSIQLDDETDYMIYSLHTDNKRRDPHGMACRIDRGGSEEVIGLDEVEIEEISHWSNARTGSRYATSWRVVIARWGLEVEIKAIVPHQEFKFMDLSYWEGACEVSGNPGGGVAYVELAGYVKSMIYDLSREK